MQEFWSVPVTEYVVLVLGFTVTLAPVIGLVVGVQVYELPPDAVKTLLSPGQMELAVAVTVMIGVAYDVNVTSSNEDVQGLFDIVHLSVLVPTERPETLEIGLFTFVKVAVPEMTVQVPVPTAGEFAANVAAEPQTEMSLPAFAAVGLDLMVAVPLALAVPDLIAVVVIFVDVEALTAIVLLLVAFEATSVVIQKYFVVFPNDELKAENV